MVAIGEYKSRSKLLLSNKALLINYHLLALRILCLGITGHSPIIALHKAHLIPASVETGFPNGPFGLDVDFTSKRGFSSDFPPCHVMWHVHAKCTIPPKSSMTLTADNFSMQGIKAAGLVLMSWCVSYFADSYLSPLIPVIYGAWLIVSETLQFSPIRDGSDAKQIFYLIII